MYLKNKYSKNPWQNSHIKKIKVAISTPWGEGVTIYGDPNHTIFLQYFHKGVIVYFYNEIEE